MFTYSNFQHVWKKSKYVYEVPKSTDYRVWINGTEIPVYACRISAHPFNVWWKGIQRPIHQSELVSYVNLVSDEELRVEVEPLTKTAYERILLKPYSKVVKTEKRGGRVAFTLRENGGYVLELDDYHGCLYLFNNKPVACEEPEKTTYYFGPGVHFPGKICLQSNESVYVDKDALVYGCIFAENAENIHVYGNGIFDDSGEERFCSHCYEPYTNGNIKFYDCKNVKLEGVGFTNSAIWCVNIFHCEDVSIDGINVFGQWRYNTDGIDIVNSKNVTVRNSFIHSFDDTITIKGIDRYAFADNENIFVENCILWCDWGKTLEIGFETNCAEYKNIIFRNCDILRGGNTACDIQNGDCAEVHDVLFSDIRIELESFYTPEQIQGSYDNEYTAKDRIGLASLVNIVNPRFRGDWGEALGDKFEPYCKQEGESTFASVRDVTFENLHVYCDEQIFQKFGTKCVKVIVANGIKTSKYDNISVKNIYLNGNKVSESDIFVYRDGLSDEEILRIR